MTRYSYSFAWLQAVIATAGSLFLSEIVGLAPCKLCWFQRICMYPLAVLFTVGWLRKDRRFYWYTLPLSLIGVAVALYHNYLVYFPTTSLTCGFDISCTQIQIEWFGFLTIPLLSLLAFTIINFATLVYLRSRPAGQDAGGQEATAA